MRLLVGFAAMAALAGCQTYDFEPVTPLAIQQTTQSHDVIARQLKPNMMILVDKSGSMKQPIDTSSPLCPVDCGNLAAGCPAGCKTRISELRSAMNTFLTDSGKVARMGLTFYPSDNFCGPSNGTPVQALPAPTVVDDAASDTVNQNNANAINTAISTVKPEGGTPTNASLRFVGSLPALNDPKDNRQDFVLLLTDGSPNCNEMNPVTCNDPTNCHCTVSSCSGSNLCTRGCLDRQGVVDAVQALRSKDIKTIVVGFGADVTGTSTDPNAVAALDTLNAMAIAGGFARTCDMATGLGCGANDTCTNGTCKSAFFQATNAAELSAALAKISDVLGTVDPCAFPLNATPTSDRFLAVIVDGVNRPAGPDTWQYNSTKNSVEFVSSGPICALLSHATSANPVKVEIRIVDEL